MFWAVVLTLILAYYICDRILRSLKVGNFTDKHVFITGCDTGFGRQCAVRLDTLGFHVFAGCLTEDGAKSLSESCSSRLVTVTLDVRKTESIEAALEVVKEKLPAEKGLWALINNAGVTGLFTASELCTREDYIACLQVNLLGMADMIRHFLPLIRISKGRIVNTASVAGRIAICPAPYCMSKYAIEGYSDVLRQEVAPQGISVSIVEPGVFKTTIFNIERVMHAVKQAYERSSAEVQSTYKDIVNKTYNAVINLEKKANPRTSLVVDAYVHAITSRYPRIRYAVGLDANLFFIPLSFLPAGIADAIQPSLLKD